MSQTPPAPDGKKPFWHDHGAAAAIVAAVIVGIATIIGALIGSDVINISVGSAIQPSSSSPTPVSSSPTPTISPSTTSQPPTSEPPPTKTRPTTTSRPATLNPAKGRFDCEALGKTSPKIRNCGDIQLPAYGGLNLDSRNSDWGLDSASEQNFWYKWGSTLEAKRSGGRQGLSRIKTGRPSYKTCVDPTRHYVWEVDVENFNANTMFCARTLLGRYAAVRMTKRWKSDEYIDLTIVTWEPKT